MSRVPPPMLPSSRLDPLLALLLLVPAAVLAWPGTLAGELEPEVSAAGWWALLALLPALSLLAAKPRPARPWITAYTVFVAASLASFEFGAPSDTFYGARAVLTAVASLSALGAGAALEARGRRVYSQGLVLLSLAFAVPALAGIAPRLQGALQNSGATSEAALLGALAACAWRLDSRPAVRVQASAAIAAYGAFVAAAPVLAGGAVFSAVLLALWFARRGERGRIAGHFAVFALGALGAFAYARATAPGEAGPAGAPAPEAAPETAPGRGHLGGVAVRLALAPRALALFADHPWLGVGAGQFRATFPAYRSAEERELSTAASAGREAEVEHAHDDFLTTLAELGLVGGGLWILVQGWLAWSALRALQGGDLARVAVALAVLGGVANAALRAPLTFNPASAGLYFAAAGALIARDGAATVTGAPPRAWLAARGLPVLGLLLLLVQAPAASAFVRHGRALRLPDGLDLPAALTARPDSPLALALAARRLAADPARRGEAFAAWERVLERRPLNYEALIQAGVLAAEAGDAAGARELWRRASALAPERAGVAVNLLLLEARAGDDEDFAAAARGAAGRIARERAVEMGAKELLAGDERACLRLWDFAGVEWAAEGGQALYDRSRAPDAGPPALVAALETLAHVRWAREHAALRDFAAATRSLRQALRLAPDARAFRLELAAALWSEGEPEDARAEVERAAARPADWTRLAPWAGEVLFAAGLFAAR